MQQLLEDKQYFNFPKVGDLIKGKIISAHKNEVHIDIDGVATGLIRGRECYNESDEYRNLKVGDEVEATVMELENENGELELSFRYAGRQKAWKNIKDNQESGEIVKALITDANKGGLIVKVDTTLGFLPVSQLAPEHYPRVPGGDKNHILEILKGYINQEFDVKILDADENEEKLIVSEKEAWAETQKDVMNKYQVGNAVEGIVTAITDFGVFVEFDDKLEGLVHISEIAWQRIDDPREFVKVGQRVKAEIIGIEGSKIFLSMKKLIKDPWHNVEEKYKIGQKVRGKVIKSNPFGLFVELDEDIHGLAHISQLSDKPVADINAFAKPNEEMDFYVISIEPNKHRLGLSTVPPKAKAEKKPTEVEKVKKVKSVKIEEVPTVSDEIKEEATESISVDLTETPIDKKPVVVESEAEAEPATAIEDAK